MRRGQPKTLYKHLLGSLNVAAESDEGTGLVARSFDFTAHMCTGMILSNYKLFVNPLFKLISIEHVIIVRRRHMRVRSADTVLMS